MFKKKTQSECLYLFNS